jgi:HEAT repeat protein
MALETSILRRTFAGFLAISLLAVIGSGRKLEPKHPGTRGAFAWSELDERPDERHTQALPAFAAWHHAALPEIGRRLMAREGAGHQLLQNLKRFAPRLASLGSDVETRRLQAARFAQLMGERAFLLIPELIQATRTTRRSETREVLAKIWMNMGSNSIPSLALLALDVDPAIRAEALQILGTLLPATDCAESTRVDLAVLVTGQLSAVEIPVVLAATRALSAMTHTASPAVPMLLQHLGHGSSVVRVAAASALGRIANRDSACVVPLTRLLADGSDDVRSAAASALAQFGRLAGPAVPQLLRTWHTGPIEVALPAVQALGRIGPEAASAVPDLALVLGQAGGSAVIRSSAAAALGRIARHPDLAVPALTEATRDADPGVRESALRALAAFGADAGPAVPALIAALADGSESTRILAAEALGRIGPGARSALPFLEAARNNNQSVMSGPVLAAVACIESSGVDQRTVAHGESSP